MNIGMLIRTFLVSSVLLFTQCVFANDFLQAHIDVTNPQLLKPALNGKSTTARLTIYNNTGKKLVITGIQCDGFDHSMLHTIEYKGGIQRMVHIKRISVPVGKKMSLTPNKTHFMLMKPNRTFKIGEIVRMDVKTNQGSFFILLNVVPHKIK